MMSFFKQVAFNPISDGEGCFHPLLGIFKDISETVRATMLKFSDFS